MKRAKKIIKWIINLNLIFWPCWIFLIITSKGFVLDIGLFQISARHITNPLIFFLLALIIKIALESSWLRSFLQKEKLSLEGEVSRLSWSDTILILLGYLALTLLFTYPLIFNFTTAVPGDGGDNPMFLWNLWWVKYALVDLKTDPFFSNYIFYPIGIGLATHTFVFLNGLLSIPFQLLFNLTIANNLILIFCFVLSAYGAYLLINYLVKDKLAAFIGGLIFAFCPYKFAHLLGHYNLMTTQWIPFYILYLIKMTREDKGKIKRALLAGLFLLLTALSDFYYLIFLIIFSLLFFTYLFFHERKTVSQLKFVAALASLFIFFTLTFSPVAWKLMADIKEGSLPQNPGGAREYVADLVGFFIPSVLHPIFGDLVRPVVKNFVGNACEWTVFVGYTVIILMLITAIKYRANPEPKFWLMSALIFFLLSFGLYPHIMGKEIKIPLPFFIINYLPIINNIRAPSRLSIMLMLSLAVLASFSLRFIFGKLNKPWKKKILFTIIMALISFEYLAIPFPLFKTQYPKIYEKIKQEKEEGVILEIPLTWQDGFRLVGGQEGQSLQMYYQTLHHKPIFGGYVARIPDAKIDYFRRIPIIGTIIKLEEMSSSPLIIDFQKEKDLAQQFIADYKIKYVIIYRSYFDSPAHQYISEIIPTEIFHQDKHYLGYKISHVYRPLKIDLDQFNLKAYDIHSFNKIFEEKTSCYAEGILRFRKTDLLQINNIPIPVITKVDISLDGQDLYELIFKSGEKEVRKFWLGPKDLPDRQMARYSFEINPALENIDALLLRGIHGDKYYFLGHLLVQ